MFRLFLTRTYIYMKKTTLLCLLQAAICLLQAQVPGYIGKKFTLEYRPDLGLNYITRTYINPVTLRNRVDVGYTVGRAMSVHAVVDYSKENYHFEWSEPLQGGDYYFTNHRVGLGAYAAFYSKKAFGFAPLGVYGTVGVYTLFPTTSHFRHGTLRENQVLTEITELPRRQARGETRIMPGRMSIGIGIGKRYIFAKRMLFDYGINYYTFFGTVKKDTGKDFDAVQILVGQVLFKSLYKLHPYIGIGVIL